MQFSDMGGFAQSGGPALVDRFGRPLNASAALNYRSDDFVSLSGSMVVQLTSPFYPGTLRVFKNGLLLAASAYTVNSPVQFTLGTSLVSTDALTVCYGSAYLQGATYVVPSTGDPYWANVVSLLHFDGTNGSTTITDVTGALWTSNGCSLSTAQVKFGSAALAGNTTSDVHSNSNFSALGTGDFTIDCWLYSSVSSGTRGIADLRGSGATSNPVLYMNAGVLTYFANGADRIIGPTVSVGSWFLLSVSRNSGNSRLFVNGTQVGSTYADATSYVTAPMYYTNFYNDSGNFSGYMDDARFTIGVGRYTSNFTPPTAAFPNHA